MYGCGVGYNEAAERIGQIGSPLLLWKLKSPRRPKMEALDLGSI